MSYTVLLRKFGSAGHPRNVGAFLEIRRFIQAIREFSIRLYVNLVACFV